MNYKPFIPAILLLATSFSYADEALDTEAAKFSYAAGVYSVRSIKPLLDAEADFDKQTFLNGIEAALAGAETALTEDEMREVLLAAEQKRADEFQKQQAMAAEENINKGQAFRDEYASGDGVQKTESGLLYKVLEEGEGEPPVKESTVVVHYAGRLIDGTEFDSSIKRGAPATFPLANVIPGWTEIVQLMKPGSKVEVVIPPELAYGQRGAGEIITPNSTLVFDIELLEVKSAEAMDASAGSDEQEASDEQSETEEAAQSE